jgi:hypothetical protein
MNNYVAYLTMLSAPLAIGIQSRMISIIKEQRIVKDVEGIDPVFSWRDWRISRATSTWMTGLRPDIRTRDFPNMKLEW